MTIVAAGLNHRSASSELLSAAAPDDGSIARMLTDARSVVPEAFVLATCNRLELYACTRNVPRVAPDLVSIVAQSRADALPPGMQARLREATTLRSGRPAIRHLLRVASGLESAVLGESEIVAQIRTALANAQRAQSIGPMLHRLLSQALRTEKRVRSEAPFDRTGSSTLSTGLRLVLRDAHSLPNETVVILGAGRLASEALWRITRRRPQHTIVVNRTSARASALAYRFGATTVPWESRYTALASAGLVISCIAGRERAVTARDLRQARATARPLVALELGVPPGLDPAIGDLPNVKLITLAAIVRLAGSESKQAATESGRAEQLIESGVDEFVSWYRERRATPLIAALHQSAQTVRRAEVSRALRRLPDLTERERRVVENLADRIVSKLLHAPMSVAKAGIDHHGREEPL